VVDGHPFLVALSLTLLNPMTIIGFAAFATRLPPTASWLDGLAHATAVVAGTFLVASGIGLAGGFVARWITTPRVLGGMNIAAGPHHRLCWHDSARLSARVLPFAADTCDRRSTAPEAPR
jgi:hypothetical protein